MSPRSTSWLSAARQPLLVCVLVVAAMGVAHGDQAWSDYISGLRARRLYSVAETYAVHRLTRDKLPPIDRADITVDLVETWLEHAQYLSAAEQDEMWARARGQLETELQLRDHPRRTLLQGYSGLVSASEGNWYRWQAQLQPWNYAHADRALHALADAITKLGSTIAAVKQEAKATGDARNGALKSYELRPLLLNLQERYAQALLDEAQVPGRPAADRAARALEAEKLARPLSESTDGDDIAWRFRVLYVQALRIKGDVAGAERYLTVYLGKSPPPEFLDQLLTEQVRCHRARDGLEDALAHAAALMTTPSARSGELHLVTIQLLAEALSDSGRKNPSQTPAAELNKTLDNTLKELQERVGGYWAYRGQLVRQQLDDVEKYRAKVTQLVREAGVALTQKDVRRASDKLAAASTAARAEKRGDLAFEIGYQRASLLVEGSLWEAAAQACQDLVAGDPQHAKASEAHLLGAYCLGRLYEAEPTQQHRADYTTALETHRQDYVGQTTFAEATYMLAQLQEVRLQNTAALKLYAEVPAEHPRSREARAGEARCLFKIVARLKELGRDPAAWQSEAETRLTAILGADRGPLDAAACEIALYLVQIQLGRPTPPYSEITGLLDRILAATAAKGEEVRARELRTAAHRWRIVSLAGQGQSEEARKSLERLALAPDELLSILDGLARQTADGSQKSNSSFGRLVLQVAQSKSLPREQLSDAQRLRLDEIIAQGYLASGQTEKASAIYAGLLKAQPNDARLLESRASLLMTSNDKSMLELALSLWKQLEAKQPAGNESWMKYRLKVCDTLLRMGKKADSKKLLTATRLLYAAPESAELAEEFAALEKLAAQ